MVCCSLHETEGHIWSGVCLCSWGVSGDFNLFSVPVYFPPLPWACQKEEPNCTWQRLPTWRHLQGPGAWGGVGWGGGVMTLPVAGGSVGKESACNAEDLGLIPGLGRSPGGAHGNPLQYSCLENPLGQRSLAGYSLWSREVSDKTEWLSTAQQTHQNHCSCSLGQQPRNRTPLCHSQVLTRQPRQLLAGPHNSCLGPWTWLHLWLI